MSQENVERVREALEVLTTEGVDAMVETFAATNGVWYTAPEWVEASEYRGHEGLGFLFSVFTDNFDDWEVEVAELLDAGGSVVGLVTHRGKIKGTDVPLSQPMGVVWDDFRQGRIGRAHFFQTWQEALEAAGLSE